MSEPTRAAEKPGKPKVRRRRRATATQPANGNARAELSLEDSARRNVHATFALGGRLIGSQERVTEKEFEDIGRGLASIARDFPAAEPYIKGIVRALGPAATFGDLFEKVNRVVGKSKLKDQVSQKRGSWRPPWARPQEAGDGTDNPAGV